MFVPGAIRPTVACTAGLPCTSIEVIDATSSIDAVRLEIPQSRDHILVFESAGQWSFQRVENRQLRFPSARPHRIEAAGRNRPSSRSRAGIAIRPGEGIESRGVRRRTFRQSQP